MTVMTMPAGTIHTRGGAQRRTTRQLRLTRRGRVAVVLAALLTLVVALSVGGGTVSQATGSGPVRAPHTVTVQPGESLWALAERIAPSMDPRLVVAQIEQLNHLAGPQVMAGQQLVVPVAR